MPASTPGRIVRRAYGLILSTSASPASMSTPASRYVSEFEGAVMRECEGFIDCTVYDFQQTRRERGSRVARDRGGDRGASLSPRADPLAVSFRRDTRLHLSSA